jgi:hypothetical protein
VVGFFEVRGLDSSIFVPWLDNLGLEVLTSDAPQAWLELFFESRQEAYPEVNEIPTSEHAFQKLGFTSSRSEFLFQSFPGNPVFQQTAINWTYFVLMMEECQASRDLEALIMHNSSAHAVFQMNGAGGQVSAIVAHGDALKSGENGIPGSDIETLLNHPALQTTGNEDKWYHATSWGYAENIIKQGINLSKGGKAMDFTSGDGFYLNPRFGGACEWCENRFVKVGIPPAVVISL